MLNRKQCEDNIFNIWPHQLHWISLMLILNLTATKHFKQFWTGTTKEHSNNSCKIWWQVIATWLDIKGATSTGLVVHKRGWARFTAVRHRLYKGYYCMTSGKLCKILLVNIVHLPTMAFTFKLFHLAFQLLCSWGCTNCSILNRQTPTVTEGWQSQLITMTATVVRISLLVTFLKSVCLHFYDKHTLKRMAIPLISIKIAVICMFNLYICLTLHPTTLKIVRTVCNRKVAGKTKF